MTQAEILEELKHLTSNERLIIAETALNLIREELSRAASTLGVATTEQMANAARTLLQDYESDTELTAFLALDGEDFCAKG